MDMNAAESAQALHDRCAIYTASSTAAKLLDLAGWTSDADLRQACLLEPCAGEGAILIEAIRRLLISLRRVGIDISRETLTGRIVSFELHPATTQNARASIEHLLASEGLSPASSQWLAQTWVRQDDFLAQPAGAATHVVANPPYVRWSKIPRGLAKTYRELMRPEATRGDLSVAFIDRMLDWANTGGPVIALVSDRWMFAQYGAAFLSAIADRGWEPEVLDARPDKPFVRQVGAYSAIVGFRRRNPSSEQGFLSPITRDPERRLHALLMEKHGTIVDAGCSVRVGPALGCGHTYLLGETESSGIEPELLRPYVGRANLLDGGVAPSGQVVVTPYDPSGKPIELKDWPGFANWASQHREKLSARSCVRTGGPWWRTIDAIGVQWGISPKLLVPELCQVPQASLDKSSAIPAHSLYAIWSTEWPIATLQKVLNAGLLRVTAEAQAPMLKEGWFRFYRRFLVQTPLPKWSSLTEAQQQGLRSEDGRTFRDAFAALFGFHPDLPGLRPNSASQIKVAISPD